jgi:hypothetical protein
VVSGHDGTGGQAAPGAPPRYYLENGPAPRSHALRLLVRSTSTGAVTSLVPDPRAGGRWGAFNALAAAGNGTYFAAWDAAGSARIYRFRLTATGQAVGLTPVPGAAFPGGYVTALAAAPGGARLAVATRWASPARLTVISTRTGARVSWRADRGPAGQVAASEEVTGLSWSANGRVLAYLERWECAGPAAVCRRTDPMNGEQDVRTLHPAAAGRQPRLDSGHLVVPFAEGNIGGIAISPDGSTLSVLYALVSVRVHRRPGAPGSPTVLQLRGTRVAVATGRPIGTLFTINGPGTDAARSFSASPSGQYLVLALPERHGLPDINDWVGAGRVHRLLPRADAVFEAW